MRKEMVRIYNRPLPAGWKEAPLKDVVELKRGYSWSKEQETLKPELGTVPVIRILNVQEKLILSPLLHLRGLSEQDVKQNAVSKGWILFVASNGNEDRIGDSALIQEDMQMVFASFLMAIRPTNVEDLLPEFLALWMRLHWVHEIFSKTAQKGSGLGNFSWGAVKRLPLRHPSITAQRQIIDAITTASRYVELTSARSPSARALISVAPSGADETDDGQISDDVDEVPSTVSVSAELELAVALRFCLLEELVSGERLLDDRLSGDSESANA